MSNLLTNRRIIFRPLGLPSFSGLALWLDAADASTITLDGSNNVSEWRDKSGNARHATQATSGSRPGYAADAVSGVSSLVYTEGKSLVTPAFDVASDPGYTIFTSHRLNTANSRFLQSWNSRIRSSLAFVFSEWQQVTDFHPTVDGSGRFISPGADYQSFEWRYTVQHNSSATNTRGFTYGKPGSVIASTGTGITFSATSSTFTVGRDVPNNLSFRGSIGEYIVYTRQLTSDEQTQALAYLAAKWKIV
jgi:hypothetical protein